MGTGVVGDAPLPLPLPLPGVPCGVRLGDGRGGATASPALERNSIGGMSSRASRPWVAITTARCDTDRTDQPGRPNLLAFGF